MDGKSVNLQGKYEREIRKLVDYRQIRLSVNSQNLFEKKIRNLMHGETGRESVNWYLINCVQKWEENP